jgi:hypothetical protein
MFSDYLSQEISVKGDNLQSLFGSTYFCNSGGRW